ncbi:MAG: DUF4838 domain-containing protein [Clostridia bacterium]|nr:DUF4838 domain-containing protein [Clostridia bacterium]
MRVIRPVIKGLSLKSQNTLIFAAQELQKYLSKVSDEDFTIVTTNDFTTKVENNTIYLGVKLSSSIPEVEDTELDDAIHIDAVRTSALITGTNARSVLIAVYRYLKELGFSFIRPGADGEYYPEKLVFSNIKVTEKASYRHRAICIEGSVFQKNLIDVIDWIPKAAMSGYFMQFQLPRTFFDRWYLEETPYREKLELSDDDIRSIVSLGEKEIEKRSLLYHGVGHGWTTQAFGIDGTSWETHEEPSEEYRDVIALVNGKRALWQGIPLNTNLCYSNTKARNRVTDNIVNYCKNHPEVSYLHFWLGDGFNNNCECDECIKKRTSDYYVQMLNELDVKLSKENIETKIVFLIYVDLLWKPLYEKLKNSNRFVLMFAPISRSYTSSFNPDNVGKMQPYELNKLKFPTNVAENLAYLKDWQQDFDCDSFDFDYHFMWDHYYDFAQYRHAQVVWGDVKNLGSIGLNGLVSCQIHRTFFPTSLSMNAMAQTLWDSEITFENIENGVLKTEFGADYRLVSSYLCALSEQGVPKALRGEEEMVGYNTASTLETAIKTIDEFVPVIKNHLDIADAKLKSAWEKLDFFTELYKQMLVFYKNVANGGEVGDISAIKDFALKNEVRFKDEFDAMYFIETFENHIVKNLKNRGDYNF